MKKKLVERINNFYFLFGILVSVIVIYMICRNYTDSDMWFILANGREIIKNGIPHMNPFTYQDGLSIVIQQWLWSVIVWGIYINIGSICLVSINILLYLLVLYLIVKIADLLEADSNVVFLVSSICFGLLGWYYINVRPTMVTITLVLIQIYLIERYIKENKPLYLLGLIPISLLEINLHSSLWILHFIIMIPYVFPVIKNKLVTLNEITYSRKPLFIIMMPMFLMGFINPYGLDGMMYLFNSYGNELNQLGIQELAKPEIASPIGMILLIQFLIILIMIFKSNKKLDSSKVYLFCGFTILGITHVRNYIYFMIGFIIMFINLIENKRFEINVKGTSIARYIIPVLFCVVSISQIFGVKDLENVKDSWETPVKAVDYIKDNNLSECNIFTDFNQGGYFEYQGIKIFMDARPELYMKSINNKKDILSDYIKIRYGIYDNDFEEFLKEYNFDYICSVNNTKFDSYLERQDNMEVVVKTDSYKLYKAG